MLYALSMSKLNFGCYMTFNVQALKHDNFALTLKIQKFDTPSFPGDLLLFSCF